jgi:hypothetical protein
MDEYYNDDAFEDTENMPFDWEEDELKKVGSDIDMDNFDEDIAMNDTEYRSEKNVFERIGMGGELIGMFSDENIKIKDPLELFRRKVRAISLQINENFPGILSTQDINKILLKAENIPYIEFKSPTSYVLGYIASNGGTKITEKSVDYVFKNLIPLVNDSTKESDFVKEPDVIRYARFWLKL